MCGILGQINFGESDFSIPPLSMLEHRGPDFSDEWINPQGNVYFGHTRLAIIDPTPTGQQPMSDFFRRFTITFNGEIYNHVELRAMLPNVIWRGDSDTETLIELLAVKGNDALRLLRGMFAFALHDAADNSVLLVRDRLGIKPLWLRSDKHSFTFSSEVRPLIMAGKFLPTTGALGQYLGFGRFSGNGQIFDRVESVPPGGWIRVAGDGSVEKGRWWPERSFSSKKINSEPECAVRIKQLVTAAVEEHLISDVGMGSFLSGGIDSSIVTLIAGKALGRDLQTFTVGFPESGNGKDERQIAQVVAKKAGSTHHELEIDEESCLSSVKEAVQKLDLPSVDAINTYIVSKAVRNTGLKVALSGLGGDELFGGYPSFRDVPLLSWLGFLPPDVSRKIVNIFPRNLKEKLGGLTVFTAYQLTVARRRFASTKDLEALGFKGSTQADPPELAGLDMMGIISWAEIQEYMIPMLLRDSDQMSMAVGLEIRVPFLDHRLLEEVLGIAQNYKKGRGVKPLLVDAFRSELPPVVYDRPKQGFELPMDKWIRGPLADFTNEGIDAAADFLKMSEPLYQKKRFYTENIHWTRIWKWCVLGHWLKIQKASANVDWLQNSNRIHKDLPLDVGPSIQTQVR